MMNLIFASVSIFLMTTITSAHGQKLGDNFVEESNKLQFAKIDLVLVNLYFKEARKDSISENQKFINESELKLKNNEKILADLKLKLYKSKQKDNELIRKKISELELKNNDLKKSLANHKKDLDKNYWKFFKSNFNNELDKLGKEIKDFSLNNKK